MLFALYFRILKSPTPTMLLPAALAGISRFAHLVNIDFFKDLMQVLKGLIELDTTEDPDEADIELASGAVGSFKNVCHRLLCINTAFELLTGQGQSSSYPKPSRKLKILIWTFPLPLSADPRITPVPSFNPWNTNKTAPAHACSRRSPCR